MSSERTCSVIADFNSFIFSTAVSIGQLYCDICRSIFMDSVVAFVIFHFNSV